MHETYTKVRENALSVLKSARNGRLFAEFCSFLPVFFDFFISRCALLAGGGGRAEGYIFGAEVLRLPRSTALRAVGWNGMTPLRGSIFNRFGEVVSRRAGIIRLIDFPVDRKGGYDAKKF